MNNVVTLSKPLYRLLVRVVMRGMYYHTAIIEAEDSRTAFALKEIERLFEVRDPQDWKKNAHSDMQDALAELKRKVVELGPAARIQPSGFFVTIRVTSFIKPITTSRL